MVLIGIIIDVGITIGNALNPLYRGKDVNADELRENLKKNYENLGSQSNGSLMRISPLAVYVSNITDNNILSQVVSSEVGFTHANEIVHMASTAFCIAIRELINGKERCDAYIEAR